MQNKTNFQRYNDGVVHIYREIERRSNFSAKINVSKLSDMVEIVKLNYAEQSKRQQDIDFANQQTFSLDLKIKTRFIKGVDNKCKCVIDGFLYDIKYADLTKTEMYLYLEGVGEIA